MKCLLPYDMNIYCFLFEKSMVQSDFEFEYRFKGQANAAFVVYHSLQYNILATDFEIPYELVDRGSHRNQLVFFFECACLN